MRIGSHHLRKILKMAVICLTACFVYLQHNALLAHEFSYPNLIHARIAVDPAFDREGTVDCYMEIFRPDVWQRYRNDEFELPARRKETLDMMGKSLKAFDAKETFTIRVKEEFQEYDTKRNAFAFRPISDTAFFTSKSGASCQSLPRELRVRFSNPAFMDGIPMSMEEGRAFLNSRKSSYGEVNRTVNVEFDIRAQKYDAPYLITEIVGARVLDDKGRVIHTYSGK